MQHCDRDVQLAPLGLQTGDGLATGLGDAVVVGDGEGEGTGDDPVPDPAATVTSTVTTRSASHWSYNVNEA